MESASLIQQLSNPCRELQNAVTATSGNLIIVALAHQQFIFKQVHLVFACVQRLCQLPALVSNPSFSTLPHQTRTRTSPTMHSGSGDGVMAYARGYGGATALAPHRQEMRPVPIIGGAVFDGTSPISIHRHG